MKAPARTLSSCDAIAIIVGIVLGAGIFKTPSIVAACSGSASAVLFLWLLGGIISFAGALCYAELASAYPNTGGDYHFIRHAFGARPAFLFAWARMTVIQTGSVAMLAFIIGDYASDLFTTGGRSPSWYAALVIIVLTAVNIHGLKQGKLLQNVLSGGIILGLASVAAAGLFFAPPLTESTVSATGFAAPGKALLFVLLTYGGWSEAAYLSAEMKQGERSMTKVLLVSVTIVTVIYLAANLAYLNSLGFIGTARSETVAADMMRAAIGEKGALFISLLVVAAALSTMNAVLITGARTNYSLGRDFPVLGRLGHWRAGINVPVDAYLLQCFIALALVALGTATRSGFSTMVEYTAPVFWFFFLLVGISLFVLRKKDPGRARPFRVPLYPFTPLLFCLFCLYLFQASLVHAGTGAVTGLAVLGAGVPVMMAATRAVSK